MGEQEKEEVNLHQRLIKLHKTIISFHIFHLQMQWLNYYDYSRPGYRQDESQMAMARTALQDIIANMAYSYSLMHTLQRNSINPESLIVEIKSHAIEAMEFGRKGDFNKDQAMTYVEEQFGEMEIESIINTSITDGQEVGRRLLSPANINTVE